MGLNNGIYLHFTRRGTRADCQLVIVMLRLTTVGHPAKFQYTPFTQKSLILSNNGVGVVGKVASPPPINLFPHGHVLSVSCGERPPFPIPPPPVPPSGSVLRVCLNVRDIKMFWEALHRATMWACFFRPSALHSSANSRTQNALLLVRPGSAKAKQLSEPEAHTEGNQHRGTQLPPQSGN